MADTQIWAISGEGFEVTQRTGVRLSQLQVFADDPASLADALGMRLPTEPNTTVGEETCAMWLAPREWLIDLAGDIRPDEWDARLRARGILYLLNGVDDGYAVFDIGGEASRDVIAHGCSLDLHPAKFGANRCARTLFAGSPSLLRRKSRPSTFRLFADPGLEWFLRDWFAQRSRMPSGTLP
ncbi:MAG: sarcosine oxidase subunit gamma family protein [Rhizomicrobium sp.]